MEYEGDRFHPSEGNDLLENDLRNMAQFRAGLDKGFHKIKQLYSGVVLKINVHLNIN